MAGYGVVSASVDTTPLERSACATHCPYCSLQCGMHLTRNAAGQWSATGRDFPSNRGSLCEKGWTAGELIDSPERLSAPLVRDRRGGVLRSATWDEALDRTVSVIRRIQAAHGLDAVGLFGSGSLTNEKVYLLGKFARVGLRTSQIDYNGRFCMSSGATASLAAFGVDRGLPFPITDIAESDAILLVGSNVAETMPPVMQHFDEQRRRGGILTPWSRLDRIAASARRTSIQLIDVEVSLEPASTPSDRSRLSSGHR